MSAKVDLVFVGGAPRSGTTLVQRVLNSHPEIYGGPEFDFISEFMVLRNRMQNSVKIGRISEYFDTNQLDTHFENFIRNIFREKALEQGVSIISEKTPRNVLHFEEILSVIPNSKAIFVIRDPRAIYNSMKDVRTRTKSLKSSRIKYVNPSHFIGSLYSATEYVKKCFEEGDFIAQKFPDRVLTVKYEDIVENPEMETRRLSQFLGIDWTVDMLNPKAQKFNSPKSGQTNNPWYSKEKRDRNIEKSDKTKWKYQISTFEKKYINERLSDYLKLFSYERENKPNRFNIFIYEKLIKFYIIFYDLAKVLFAHFKKKK